MMLAKIPNLHLPNETSFIAKKKTYILASHKWPGRAKTKTDIL